MRDKLTIILLLLSIILLVFVMFVGIEICDIHILSLSQLKSKNDDLNTKINMVSDLTSKDFPDAVGNLEETYEKLTIEKQKYQDLTGFTDEDDIEELYETKKYDIGYLWETLGKYATRYNLVLGIEVQNSNNGENLYNLNFTVSGQYVNISQFISDIENDSDLYFRIYNFKMSGNEQKVSSSFTVRDILIDPDTLTNDFKIDENTEINNVVEE